MRIAQVLTASTGGIGRHVASLVPRLLDRGHQVEVFCPDITAHAQGFAQLGVVVRPLRELARSRSADVVHAHGYKAGALAAAALVFARPPLVYLYLISLGGGSQDLGLGSAGTIILTAVVVVIGVVQLRIFSVGGTEDRA